MLFILTFLIFCKKSVFYEFIGHPVMQQDNADDFQIFLSENKERSISNDFLELIFSFNDLSKEQYISFIEFALFYNTIQIFTLQFDCYSRQFNKYIRIFNSNITANLSF